MRMLLAATSLTPFLLLSFQPASAETLINTAVTTPVLTGTANDDVRVGTSGSVKPTGGAAITINSSHSVRNEGTVGVTGANNSAGIVANTNLAGNITNIGTITVDENYTATDSDNDGDLDGPFAQGSGRFGIHVLGGGVFTGTIANNGAIGVEGNQSAGIAIDSALNGSLTTGGGAITVVGDDSYGIRASAISGNVRLIGGSVAVVGANSVGVALDGNVGGALIVQNMIGATGYRSTVAPADTSKLDSDDLLQGGPALRIGGNVAGGILFDAPPADNDPNDTDEDDDGIADSAEVVATVRSFGSAPAVLIGSSTQDIAVGAVAGSADGLVMRGIIGGSGVYKGVNATGLSIGGSGGHTVSLAGGATITGTVGALAVEGNATAIRVGSGASVPTVTNSGTIQAVGGGTDATRATAVLIESGATLTTLRNSGFITSQIASNKGTGAAIVDNSGTLTLIENKGAIGVASAGALGDRAIAIDLRANASGATVRQQAVTSGTAPQIAGNILFGSGNDVLDIADGSVNGTVRFGAGSSQLSLSGDAVLNGDVDFGGGAGSLALAGTSVLRGNLANSANVAATVGAGATLDATKTGSVGLASLTTGAGSTLGVTIGADGSSTRYVVSGAASFGTDTRIALNLTSLDGVAGTYTIVQAGSVTGAANLLAHAPALPFLYDADIGSAVPGQVNVTVGLKSAEQLGINGSEAAILDAVIKSADSDAPVAAAFLDLGDSDSLQSALQQMLPEHAGGAFETVTRSSRLTARVLTDPNSTLVEAGGLGLWAQQVAWGGSKAVGSTSSYKLSGWGASAGLETSAGKIGNVGLSLAYLAGKDGRNANELISSQLEAGVYWRGGGGPLRGFARATAGRVSFDGSRYFNAIVDGTTISREAEGEWRGTLYSAIGGAYYEFRSGRFSVRPLVTVEHFKLKEKSYSETGGGSAFNLAVDGRSSSETAANAMMNLGFDLAGTKQDDSWFRLELEGGWRSILSGKLGRTTARFENGDPFTLTPEERTSGWLAGLRAIGGGGYMSVVGEITAEEQQGKASLGGRLGLQIPL